MSGMTPFRKLQAQTVCPFSAKAKIWYGLPWDRSQTYETNIAAQAADLHNFLRVAREEKYQGYVAEVSLPDADDFARVIQAFKRYLFALATTDDSCDLSMRADPTAPGWQFVYARTPIFLNVFAPCYPAPHSKRVEAVDCFYVFFQPEFTFDFCGVNRSRTELKESIRRDFSVAGMPYNGSLIDLRQKAMLYMFPLKPHGPPVKWWE